MLKTVLISALILISTQLMSQISKLNETVYSFWNNNSWDLSSKLTYTYDLDGRTASLLYDTWNIDTWNNYMKYEYSYDSQKRISLIIIYKEESGNLSDYMRIEYFYSTENDDYESITTMLNGLVWENYSKTYYTIGENSNPTTSLTCLWSDGLWTDYSKTDFEYTGTGETDEYVMYIRENDSWSNYYRFDYIYDAENLNYLSYKYMWNGGWQQNGKDDNTFDDINNMILSVTQSYSEGSWTNQSKAEYSYVEFTGIEQTSSALPTDIELHQNYPNPFNPKTEISFSLKKASEIKLNVYDIKGNLVRELSKGVYSSGIHKINFDASELNSGVYFYRIIYENNTATKKMTILK